jgi:hypothetical protein
MIIPIITMRFYDRQKEQQLLEHLYETAPSFLVITGRRRVGKTELIREFEVVAQTFQILHLC